MSGALRSIRHTQLVSTRKLLFPLQHPAEISHLHQTHHQHCTAGVAVEQLIRQLCTGAAAVAQEKGLKAVTAPCLCVVCACAGAGC